jgi:hypothetical protein
MTTSSPKNQISLHIEIIYHVSTRRAIFKLTERRYHRLAVAFRCFMTKKIFCMRALHCEMCRRVNVPRKTCFLPYFFKKPGQKLVELSFILIYSSA